MQFLIFAVLFALFWMWLRGPAERRATPDPGFQQTDRQIEALTSRVATLETILLDRDRQLRDRFGDL